MSLSPTLADHAYGERATAMLVSIGMAVRSAVPEVVRDFYATLFAQAGPRAVLDRLTDVELAHLRERQSAHLLHMVSPGLTASDHRALAIRVGRIHAMLGVDIAWLADAYVGYQHTLRALINQRVPDQADASAVLDVLARRLQIELEGQAEGYRALEADLTAHFERILGDVQTSTNLQDLCGAVIRGLASIDGMTGACVGRIDIDGNLAVEMAAGERVTDYLAAIEDGILPPIRLAPPATQPTVPGPASIAWQTGEIEVDDAFLKNPVLAPWHSSASRLGLRSALALPLVDEVGNSFMILYVFSQWQGFFGMTARQTFWRQLREGMTQAANNFAQGVVIPQHERKRMSGYVRAGRVRMLYQPVIDLRSRALVAVEALARLIDEQHALVSPAVFLPALGQDDLLHLFEHGLRQVCETQKAWHRQHLDLTVAVNLPPQGIVDARYHRLLFGTLESSGTDTERIQLEVLETPEHGSKTLRDAFFSTARSLGITIVQDDLGAGHSSLLRMSSMPFDGIKLDQALLRQLLFGDVRALGFIYHITRLAHGLGLSVTAEGLELPGMIEAAAILGVDKGQGFAIGRPLPADAIPHWQRTYPGWSQDAVPGTALGALAAQLLWDEQLEGLCHWPGLIRAFAASTCAVRRYADTHARQDTALHEILRRNRNCAIQGASDAGYRGAREELIHHLSQRWQAEVPASLAGQH